MLLSLDRIYKIQEGMDSEFGYPDSAKPDDDSGALVDASVADEASHDAFCNLEVEIPNEIMEKIRK